MFSFLDIILLSVALACVWGGIHKGFIRTLGGVLGLIGGGIAGYAGLSWFSSNIISLENRPIWSISIFLFVMLASSQLIGFIFELADKAWKILSIIPFLTSINKLLGAVLGLVEAIVILAAFSYLAQTFIQNEGLRTAIEQSIVLGWLAWTQALVSG